MTADSAMSYPSYVNPQVLTMFNVSTLLNQKDSRWLQLEVCREFQRQKCTRCDAECKFAHPPANVEVQNGRVTACYDSIKVREFAFHRRKYWVLGVQRRSSLALDKSVKCPHRRAIEVSTSKISQQRSFFSSQMNW